MATNSRSRLKHATLDNSETLQERMDYPASYSIPQYTQGELLKLNVGGRRFTTSRQTLLWVQDSFFTSLLSGRIPSVKDETGAIFIDRDPNSFEPILHYLRTKEVKLRGIDARTLRSEAEYYGVTPLVRWLMLCEDLGRPACGGILFAGTIPAPMHCPALDGPPSSALPPNKLSSEVNKVVRQIVCHGNCMAVVYLQAIHIFSMPRESRGWDLLFTTPPLDRVPSQVALRTKLGGAIHLGDKLLAAVLGTEVRVWSCSPAPRELTTFDTKMPVDSLFFIGNQLVVLSNVGRVAVWQSMTRHWQVQEVVAICSFDQAGSFLLLGCTNGSIYHIGGIGSGSTLVTEATDMEKFPLRMKDNDLLVTELFQDPSHDPITSLSVYLTPALYSGGFNQQWIEIAYGTKSGAVKLIVQHPENVGQAPQIFESFPVHTCPLSKVVLGERHLISVCMENHVRTWNVTRFRGRISTQPGSSSTASYKVLALEGPNSICYPDISIGPYGEVGEEQVFVQRVVPETSKLFVRLCSSGQRVCEINSVDNSVISTFAVHEFEGANRLGSRSRRYIITGHSNGNVQLWDLTTALEQFAKLPPSPGLQGVGGVQGVGVVQGGPDQDELLDLLHSFDISTSRCSSTVNSRAPSPSPSLFSMVHKPNIPSTPIFHRLGMRGSGRQVIVPTPLHSVSERPALATASASSSQSSWTDGPWEGLRQSDREGSSASTAVRPSACRPDPDSLSSCTSASSLPTVVETRSPAPTDPTKATTPAQCEADGTSSEGTLRSPPTLPPVTSSPPGWEHEWRGNAERHPAGHSRTCSMPPQLPGNHNPRRGRTRSQSDYLHDSAAHDHAPQLRSAQPTIGPRQDMYAYYLQSGFPASDC